MDTRGDTNTPKTEKPKISPTQIRMGTQHELEHTSSRTVAKKIAMDHLNEHPKYYTYLNKMENQMKRKGI
jgi:hypothetical protein